MHCCRLLSPIYPCLATQWRAPRAQVDRQRKPIRSTSAVFQLSIGLLLIDKPSHEPLIAVRIPGTYYPYACTARGVDCLSDAGVST